MATISIRIDEIEKEALQKYANDNDLSVSQVVRKAIKEFLVNDKLATLQNENQALRFRASQAEQNTFITANQNAQTAELIRRLGADCPTPAYIVPNPNCCFNYNVTGVGYGNNGCGCGF